MQAAGRYRDPSRRVGRRRRSAGKSADRPAEDQIQLSPLLAQLSQGGASEHLAKLSQLGLAVSKCQYQVDANAVSGGITQDGLASGSAEQR